MCSYLLWIFTFSKGAKYHRHIHVCSPCAISSVRLWNFFDGLLVIWPKINYFIFWIEWMFMKKWQNLTSDCHSLFICQESADFFFIFFSIKKKYQVRWTFFQRSLRMVLCPSGFINFCQQKTCTPIRFFLPSNGKEMARNGRNMVIYKGTFVSNHSLYTVKQ